MKKGDIFIICLVLCVAAAFFGYNALAPKQAGKTVVVKVDNAELCRLPLNKDTTLCLAGNTVTVKGGKAFISSADCPDLLCAGMKPISNVGETVVCLPNRVVLEVSE